jgi:predicted acetyltransferase
VHEAEPGNVDGYVIWRVEPCWTGGLPDSLVRVRELIALTPQAEGALWRLVLDLDLAGTVQIVNRPPDEPLRWRLADSRQLRTTRVSDGLWVRLQVRPGALARGHAILACDSSNDQNLWIALRSGDVKERTFPRKDHLVTEL